MLKPSMNRYWAFITIVVLERFAQSIGTESNAIGSAKLFVGPLLAATSKTRTQISPNQPQWPQRWNKRIMMRTDLHADEEWYSWRTLWKAPLEIMTSSGSSSQFHNLIQHCIFAVEEGHKIRIISWKVEVHLKPIHEWMTGRSFVLFT